MSEAASVVKVLAILPSPEDRTCLTRILGHAHWNLHFADRLEHASALIDGLGAGVVISDCTLPDASWQDVLHELQQQPAEPPLIVVSRLADDRLWAEVLNLGGYDVLSTPFDTTEVTRSVGLAWRHWHAQASRQDRSTAKVMRVGSADGPQFS
jgi:DNA-binding response OmpR family regulator